jgi:hypothetical protein
MSGRGTTTPREAPLRRYALFDVCVTSITPAGPTTGVETPVETCGIPYPDDGFYASPYSGSSERLSSAEISDGRLARLASAVMLKGVLGCTLEEIVESTGSTLPAVKAALVRGRAGISCRTSPMRSRSSGRRSCATRRLDLVPRVVGVLCTASP